MAANNGARMTPILIVTRPAAQSASFAREIAALWDGPLRIIQSPLIEIVFYAPHMDQPDAVIFTSANGVTAAGLLDLPKGLTAWCVGEKTGQIAAKAGFDPVIGPGDADGLARKIIADAPKGRLLHIRGRHTRGEICEKLTAAGLHCHDVIAYDQKALPLSAEAVKALGGTDPVVFPLFSPRTATILTMQGPFAAHVHGVAISETAKRALDMQHVSGVRLAARPDNAAMIDATIATLRNVIAQSR